MTESHQNELDDARDEPVFLRPPSACGTEFEQVDWVGTLEVDLDGARRLGIRFNDGRLLEATGAALGDRATVGDDDTPPYFSVKLNEPTRRRKHPLHYVYLGARPVVGSRDVQRLLDGLAAHLGQHLEAPPTDVYTAPLVPVRSPAGVLLVPGDLAVMSKVVDRVLRPEGYVAADVPFVHLDLANAEVVVPTPVVHIALDAATRAELPSDHEERLTPGRYPVARWLVAVGAEDAGPLRHSMAVLHATRGLRTPFPHGAQAAVDDVARATKDVPVAGVTWASDEELVQAVLEAGAIS